MSKPLLSDYCGEVHALLHGCFRLMSVPELDKFDWKSGYPLAIAAAAKKAEFDLINAAHTHTREDGSKTEIGIVLANQSYLMHALSEMFERTSQQFGEDNVAIRVRFDSADRALAILFDQLGVSRSFTQTLAKELESGQPIDEIDLIRDLIEEQLSWLEKVDELHRAIDSAVVGVHVDLMNQFATHTDYLRRDIYIRAKATVQHPSKSLEIPFNVAD